jgi:hypothetical protein
VIFRGTFPHFIAHLIAIAVLVAFPSLDASDTQKAALEAILFRTNTATVRFFVRGDVRHVRAAKADPEGKVF